MAFATRLFFVAKLCPTRTNVQANVVNKVEYIGEHIYERL